MRPRSWITGKCDQGPRSLTFAGQAGSQERRSLGADGDVTRLETSQPRICLWLGPAEWWLRRWKLIKKKDPYIKEIRLLYRRFDWRLRLRLVAGKIKHRS